jgi:hypothetical protein
MTCNLPSMPIVQATKDARSRACASPSGFARRGPGLPLGVAP